MSKTGVLEQMTRLFDDSMSLSSLANAYALILELPSELDLPSIGLKPDGLLTLEWNCSDRWLSISVGSSILCWVASLGQHRVSGSIPYYPGHQVPITIVELINKITKSSG